jgi:ABC-type uncharacterized transport system permease subunit
MVAADGRFWFGVCLSETLTRAIPLMFTGLAAAVAFKARLFNIGAEGQLYAGRWRRWRWAVCMAAQVLICHRRAVPADDAGSCSWPGPCCCWVPHC